MIGFIEKWRERRRRKRILKDIKKAKEYYVNGKAFMCYCFMLVDYRKYPNYDAIRKEIPEFNRKTLGAEFTHDWGAWWDYEDKEPRIKAFNKLIEIYSNRHDDRNEV